MASANTTSAPYDSEQWKPIPGWEGLYSASDMGRIRSEDRVVPHSTSGKLTIHGRTLRQKIDRKGYRRVSLSRGSDGVSTRLVHQLVMESFVGKRLLGIDVCHNNGDPADNRLCNLRYDSRSGNMYDKRRHGTDHEVNKTRCPQGHKLEAPNLRKYSKDRGHRTCLSCGRARSYISHHKSLEPDFQKIADRYYADIMRDAQPPAA